MFLLILKTIGVAIFSSLLIVSSFIIFPDFVYSHVKNKKIKKFLEHDLVILYWMLLTVFIDILLIQGFIDLIE